MESGRLKQVMILNGPMYAKGAPVLLESCGLYTDSTGGSIAQLIWRNLDERPVSAMNVTLTTFTVLGGRIEDIDYTYSGLEAASCQEFGREACIPVGKAHRYTVQLYEVVFSDGSVNRVGCERWLELLPESEPLKSGKLNSQYIQDLKNAGYPYSKLNAPQKALGLWQCVCGQWNKSGTCCKCSITRNELGPIRKPVNLKRTAKVLAVCLAAAFLLYVYIVKPEISYRSAMRLLNECRYDEAAEIFWEICYSDSEEKYIYSRYMKAQWLQSEGRYSEAIAVYEELDDYSDSKAQITECQYQQAALLQSEGRYGAAIAAYRKLKGYSDSEAQITECRYQQATALQAAGEYAKARAIYEELNGFRDSAERNHECKEHIYQQAVELKAEGSFVKAAAIFENLKGFSDSVKQLNECKEQIYQQAAELEAAGSYSEAQALFEGIDGYSDSGRHITECRYQQALQLQAAGEYAQAASVFEELDGYGDSGAQLNECRYQQAAVLTGNGEYAEAYALYAAIPGYRDVDSIIRNDAGIAEAARDAAVAPFKKIGSYVTFGTYTQTKSRYKEAPVEWLVLDVQDNKALLLSRYGLDAQPYNKTDTDTTWETCTLRKWMNSTFLKKLFTPEEQKAVLTTTVRNDASQCYSQWSENGGNDTQDKLFLLSCKEARLYLGVEYWNFDCNKKAVAAPTEYASENGARVSSDYRTSNGKLTGWWWLRSPGSDQADAAYVSFDGNLRDYGAMTGIAREKCGTKGAIRPAFWIDLESDFFLPK